MLQRNIVFPSKIKAIALDPTEHVLYAGSEDGKIFVAALNTTRITTNDQVSYITGSFSNHRLSFHLLLSTVLNCCHPLILSIMIILCSSNLHILFPEIC